MNQAFWSYMIVAMIIGAVLGFADPFADASYSEPATDPMTQLTGFKVPNQNVDLIVLETPEGKSYVYEIDKETLQLKYREDIKIKSKEEQEGTPIEQKPPKVIAYAR